MQSLSLPSQEECSLKVTLNNNDGTVSEFVMDPTEYDQEILPEAARRAKVTGRKFYDCIIEVIQDTHGVTLSKTALAWLEQACDNTLMDLKKKYSPLPEQSKPTE